MTTFHDRSDAGVQLAGAIESLALEAPVVLALPRGGVPVAVEVAGRLGAPLDVFVARKVGAPHQPELGIGAVAEGGSVVADAAALDALGLDRAAFETLVATAEDELQRRVRRYRGTRALVEVAGRDVVLVDDGLATGVTAEAALRALRRRSPRTLVLAVPVCARDTAARLRSLADQVACVSSPDPFVAVGRWYDRFDQTSDEEVLELLERAGPEATPETPMTVERPVAIPVGSGDDVVRGDLTVPEGAIGLVVFAHGSGSSRRSGRNRRVAATLQVRGLATLLLDLLTEDEEMVDLRTRELRFDIDLLAGRLESAVQWAAQEPATAGLPVGCFGASTGAAAALVAAARMPDRIGAVVSRGGRADLAGGVLAEVRAPTLLVVGGADHEVLARNREAAGHLRVEHHLEVVPGATHLFEEPGALEQVADLAAGWFASRLGAATVSR